MKETVDCKLGIVAEVDAFLVNEKESFLVWRYLE